MNAQFRTIHAESQDFEAYYDEHDDLSAKIKFCSEFEAAVIDHFSPNRPSRGNALPWQKGREFRLRPSEVTVWAGVNGTGKSLLTGQVMLGAVSDGAKLFLASLEMAPVATLARMMRQASAGANPSEAYIHNWLWKYATQLLVLDHRGVVRPKQMLGCLQYIHDKMGGVDHVVIDSLMKCGIGTDDYNTQKWFVNELCAFANNTRTHVHLVAHARKSESASARIDKFSIKGASEISDQVDNVVLVWRNKDKEEKARQGIFTDDPD